MIDAVDPRQSEEQATREWIERTARRAASRRALELIGEHVEETHAEIGADRQARRLLVLLVLVGAMVAGILWLAPVVARVISAALG